MAGCVARAVVNLPFGFTKSYCVTIFQPAVSLKHSHALNAVTLTGFGDAVDPELIVAMRAFDHRARALFKFGGTSSMISMAMGDPYLIDAQSAPLDLPQHGLKVTARIDNRRLVSFGAPHDRTVLLKRRNRGNKQADRGIGHRVNSKRKSQK